MFLSNALLIVAGLLGVINAGYNDHNLERRVLHKKGADILNKQELKTLFIQDLSRPYDKFAKRASGSETSSKSGSTSPSRGSSIQWINGHAYVHMDGKIHLPPDQHATLPGLNGCTGLIAHGPNGSFLHHIVPGNERAAVSDVKTKVKLLGPGTQVHLRVPGNLSINIEKLTSRLRSVPCHVKMYQTKDGDDDYTGHEMHLSYKNGRPHVH